MLIQFYEKNMHILGNGFPAVLGNFGLADYIILIIMLTLTLFLGILKIRHLYKTQVYVGAIIGSLSYMLIKDKENLYYAPVDHGFIIILGKILGGLLIAYLLILQEEEKKQEIRFEYPTMVLIGFFGILLSLENTEGILIFLGLEIQAFTFYTMVSLGEKNIFSAEGALKYFLIGALASGVFVLGLGVLYSTSGTTNLLSLEELMTKQNSTIILGGLLLVMGILFKIGAAPFHLWLPDAYEGAPFYVLIYLMMLPKIVLFYLIYNLANIFQSNLLILLSLILSAVIGAIQAVEQTKIKRFLAYTVIYNNSFFLSLALLSGTGVFYSLMESLTLYLILNLTTVLSFFLLRSAENNENLLSLRDLLIMKRSNSTLAWGLALSFFSAAGIPPFIGFFQKYLILLELTENLDIFVSCVLIFTSILAAFYYIRMSKVTYFLSHPKHLLLANISKTGSVILALGLVLSIGIFY